MPVFNPSFTDAFPKFLVPFLISAGCLFACNPQKKPANIVVENAPRVLDERLELHLIARDPDIVTPIGIAVDSLDRIFVLESHTHLPPKDYPGPDGDIIKLFEDTDGDGQPDKISVFAEGLQEGLNLAFSPEGHLYAVTSRAVWALYDRDGDGRCDEPVKILELTEPEKVYAHAALLGITFSTDGWMYVSRGNTSSAYWRMAGTDSSSVSGYGDGGNIVRARPDGTQLEEVATGFWNPVDLKFDERGRLLAADNDPDSRGPNRLVHIVPGGDYGYQSLYGGSGIHPYLAWNGELPGTLPYAAGLGEAPSGLLNANEAALPPDYRGQLLCTIWEESRIVRIGLRPEGVSLSGSPEVILEGDPQFRPVAFATDRKGTIYFTDWVLRDYPNHGKGRIWKLSARPGVEVMQPRPLYATPLPDPEGRELENIYAADAPGDFARVITALQSADPFVRHAAVMVLSRPVFRPSLPEATRHPDPDVRLGALLAMQRSAYPNAEPVLRRLLNDPDERIRQRALIWAGQAGMLALKPDIDRALTAGPTSAALFETYLETVSHLDPAFIGAYRNRSENFSKSIKRSLPPAFIESFIRDKSRPAALRALAIRHLDAPAAQLTLLTSLLHPSQAPQLRLEAVRSLAAIPAPEAATQLLALAKERKNPVLLRAEALLALARQPAAPAAGVIPLLQDPEMDIRLEAARYLRTRASADEVAGALQQTYASLTAADDEPLREQLALALSPEQAGGTLAPRPTSLAEWQTALTAGGDPVRGRRVLFSVQSMCSMCHAVEGRGGDLGPDLTNTGLSKTRAQLVHSILRPSEEVSPEYQGWYIALKSGETYQGRQIDVGGHEIDLYTQAAGFVTFAKKDVADYGMVERSLMPDGLENQLTVSDLRDLIAFLEAKSEAGMVSQAGR